MCRQSPSSPSLNSTSPALKRSRAWRWRRHRRAGRRSASGAKRDWIARRMNISSISRLTASTELIRRFIERRGVSISTQLAPATIVAERRRPEIRLISPKNSPRLRRDALLAFGVEHDLHFAVDDAEKGIRIVVALEDRLARLRREDFRIEHEFAQLQRRDVREQAHVLLHALPGPRRRCGSPASSTNFALSSGSSAGSTLLPRMYSMTS